MLVYPRSKSFWEFQWSMSENGMSKDSMSMMASPWEYVHVVMSNGDCPCWYVQQSMSMLVYPREYFHVGMSKEYVYVGMSKGVSLCW